jgi:hypothetical protein
MIKGHICELEFYLLNEYMLLLIHNKNKSCNTYTKDPFRGLNEWDISEEFIASQCKNFNTIQLKLRHREIIK